MTKFSGTVSRHSSQVVEGGWVVTRVFLVETEFPCFGLLSSRQGPSDECLKHSYFTRVSLSFLC